MKNKLFAFLIVAASLTSAFSGRAHALYYDNWTPMWAPGDVIPLCWVDPGMESEKAKIREVLANTWLAVANISFAEFGLCPTTGTAKYVRIYLHASQSGGFWADAGKNALKDANAPLMPAAGRWVNASMHMWFPPNGAPVDRQIVHEFGHTLGFWHEMDRPDNPLPEHPECNPPGSMPGTYLSPFDHDTVMNYCSSNNEGMLTARDVEGAQKAYPYIVPYLPLSIPLASTSSEIRSGIYYRGRTNGSLQHNTVSGFTTFTSVQELPHPARVIGAVESTPAVIVQPSSTLVFWKGRDGKLWQREVAASTLTSTGGNVLDVGPLNSAPQAATSNGVQLVIWRGADGYLYARRRVSSVWSSATKITTTVATSEPALVATLPGFFEVYWRGANNSLWRMQSSNGGVSWATAQQVNFGALTTASLDSAPYAVGQSDGTVDIFWRGSDKYLYQVHGSNLGSGPVVRHNSGTLRSDPSPTLTSAGTVYVFWSGSDKNLWYMSSSFNNWSAAVKTDEWLVDAAPRAAGNDTGAIDVAYMAGKKIALKRYRPGIGWTTTRYVNGPGL